LSLYRVREFAALAGVTVKALHHYDRLGLLKPRRTSTGYRVYSQEEMERLEQIVALKFLGLPLKQIKAILERPALELRDALRLQRRAIEDKRALLGQVIRAIEAAEGAGDPADPAVLRKIIEVIEMQNGIETMKKYYSEEAWERHRHYYQEGPSPEWRALYRDVVALLEEDPGAPASQAAAERWLALSLRAQCGDPEAQTDSPTAWVDRASWPAVMKRRIEEYRVEEVMRFLHKAGIACRRKYFGEGAWGRHQTDLTSRSVEDSTAIWQARVDLFRDVEAAAGEDPEGEKGQALARRWVNHLRVASGGDPEILTGMLNMWADRRRWSSLVRYSAEGMSMMAGERFDRVMDFLDSACLDTRA
jgi:MerR family transcriptional regulator, thiopeptide resistance regulator